MSSKTERQLWGEKLIRELREQLERYEELETECERLKERVGQLETERQELRRSAVVLQAERDGYLRSLYVWADQQLRDEDLQCFAQEEKTVDLLQFLRQLEQQDRQLHGQ